MDATITPTRNGPLHAQRVQALRDDRGEVVDASESIFLCHCGGSQNKPFCDGMHTKIKFRDGGA